MNGNVSYFSKFFKIFKKALKDVEICTDPTLAKEKNNFKGLPKIENEKDKKIKVFKNKISINDVIQGNLDDCSFFASLAAIINDKTGDLKSKEKLIREAIPYYNEVKIIYF